MTIGLVRWARQTTSGLPTLFWYLWVGTLINRMGIFVVPFLTLFLTEKQGLSVGSAAFIVSLFGLGSFTAQFVGGYTTDRWGRRPTMLVSFFVTPLLVLLMGFSSGFWLLALLNLLVGFFTDVYRPASSALIADIVPAGDRSRAFSLRFWAINLGAAIGLSLGGWLASQNYLYLFIGDAITTLGFGLVTFFYIPETRPPQPAREVKPAAKWNWTQFKAQFAGEGQLLRFTVMFSLLLVISSSVYRQDGVTMPLAMKSDGLSEADYGNVIALNGIVIVLVSLVINQLLAKYGHLHLMAGSVLLIGLGFGLYVFADAVSVYAFGVILWTLGEIIGAPIAPALLADLAPIHRRGFYQGMIGASHGLAAFVGPIVGGLVYSYLGEIPLWIGCLLAESVVALSYLGFMRPLYQKLREGRQ